MWCSLHRLKNDASISSLEDVERSIMSLLRPMYSGVLSVDEGEGGEESEGSEGEGGEESARVRARKSRDL
jgi:hypothetical protein